MDPAIRTGGFRRPNWSNPYFLGRFTDTVVDCYGGVDQQFAYNAFQFEETLVTEWNMVCDEEPKVTPWPPPGRRWPSSSACTWSASSLAVSAAAGSETK